MAVVSNDSNCLVCFRGWITTIFFAKLTLCWTQFISNAVPASTGHISTKHCKFFNLHTLQCLLLQTRPESEQYSEIIIGDFNIDLLFEKNHCINSLMGPYQQHVSQATTENNSLSDHEYTKNIQRSTYCLVLESQFSDYKPIVLQFLQVSTYDSCINYKYCESLMRVEGGVISNIKHQYNHDFQMRFQFEKIYR